MTFSLKGRHWIVIFSLLGLIGLGFVGLVFTRDETATTNKPTGRRPQLVNTSAVQTARQLAATASGRDEQRLARQALKSADHAVDLAFATALREAAQQREEPTPETRELFDRVKKTEVVVKTEQDQIDQLKKQLAAAPASRQDSIQQHLNLAQLGDNLLRTQTSSFWHAFLLPGSILSSRLVQKRPVRSRCR